MLKALMINEEELRNTYSGFTVGHWTERVDVRDFIQKNYTEYRGDASFLTSPTPQTVALWDQVLSLLSEESQKGGTLSIDTKTVAGVDAFPAGYIDRDKEVIVGLQTDEPLKRAIMPQGGVRTVAKACKSYGYELDPDVEKTFSAYRKTHNDGVFSAYTQEIRDARRAGIITGLPDGYSRGRIIGDYRRVALYGVDRLIQDKREQKSSVKTAVITEDTIRAREELDSQISSLKKLITMAEYYGFDISRPAQSAQEAVQWTYFAYLAAVKEQDGAAMSLGRVSAFLDIYFERDMAAGILTEEAAQEIIDHFVMKLRMVRFLRTPDYNELFSGDPTWVTECVGGMGVDGRSLVTKTTFRVLHTLYNLGPAPEPNLTVLWSPNLPEAFKRFSARVSIDTSSIQYENDELMRPYWGDDYSIACCVSAMKTGKQMQFFGARCNLAKALLYSINGGRDELSGVQVGPKFEAIQSEYLSYDEVVEKFDYFLGWISNLYVNALNIIHYMHDKYNYESLQMALHDKDVTRTMACGVAGLSVVADALSAIKYAKVRTIRDEAGYVIDYEIEGDYPKFGNNDDRVDTIASDLVELFMDNIKKNKTYRDSYPTMSILTITSNVVYGKKTGNTPDGRKEGEPFAPGANPMHGRDEKGAVASMASVAKLPYEYAQDGISYTFSIEPQSLGMDAQQREENLVSLLDGYVIQNGHHININVIDRDMLYDAMEHPEKYPQLTIRVSGYAVNFIKLTREQQLDVINRTFHSNM
ncbi:formate C-acetyltransferase [Chitinivibrio alkaliphilus]|uniref:Formate acetyltransferase n=1 Tax=Chitinivibrio alkaliphilus ACht1 TaxID=1313304 RepID=U7D5X6_9BACT|nr:pyruvate formate lyase [Chitinivibrio alkaliphilus ACht1]